MTPLLSVIVPVYNTKKYLRECIDSILAQTYNDYELILVDDGSSDGSSEICDEYAGKHENVHVIHKENCGLLHTRKVGFEKACGKYISYIDSDDFITPDMYEHMMGKITEHDVDIAICNIEFDTNGKREKIPCFSYDGLFEKEKLVKEVYPYMLYSDDSQKTNLPPSLCNKIIRKNVLKKALEYADNTISFGEDALCSFPCLLDAESVYICKDKYFYIYRRVPNSLTRAYDEKLFDKFKLLITLLDKAFVGRGFDAKSQLYCYAVRGSLECIRNQLLHDKKKFAERTKKIDTYLNFPIIKTAFENVTTGKFDNITRLKLFLIKKHYFRTLFFLLLIRNQYSMLRGTI